MSNAVNPRHTALQTHTHTFVPQCSFCHLVSGIPTEAEKRGRRLEWMNGLSMTKEYSYGNQYISCKEMIQKFLLLTAQVSHNTFTALENEAEVSDVSIE